jgi:DNA-directed RNA polymerase specialized sigma24 family protein
VSFKEGFTDMREHNGEDGRLFWSNEFTKHYDVLLRYSLRLTNGNENRALDLVQQVALRILQYLPDPASVKSPKFFLLRSVRNSWIKSRLPVDEVSLDQAFEVIAELPGLAVHSQLQANLELVEVLDRARKKMAVRFAGFNQLYEMWLSGATFREINEAFGRDRGFAEVRWYRFLDEVRKQLSPPQSKSTKKPAA